MAADLEMSYYRPHNVRYCAPLSVRIEGFIRGLVFATMMAAVPGIPATLAVVGLVKFQTPQTPPPVLISYPTPSMKIESEGFSARVVGNIGGSRMFTREMTGMNQAGQIYWRSENPSIVEIDENTGVAHFLSAGRAEVCSTDRVTTTSCIEVESK
jgi:hypothetical protein